MNCARWKDGLYRVECGSFTGEFKISSGHLISLSPCLRHAFDIFARSAQWVAPLVITTGTLERPKSNAKQD
jgi:hypothetical protein